MNKIHILTPVKDSIDFSMQTIGAVLASRLTLPYTYTVYNDFSTPDNTARLTQASRKYGFRLVNLSEYTSHPSPNYLTVLQMAQREALRDETALIIVESDVIVRPDTLQGLVDGIVSCEKAGLLAAVTVDEDGIINYPYGFAKGRENQVIDTRKHCSFCCSLLTPALLKAFDFQRLDASKNWFDVTISHESLNAGLHNYLFTTLPVIHRPHSSRPWKQLKYKNPLKYYWRKFIKGFDKI